MYRPPVYRVALTDKKALPYRDAQILRSAYEELPSTLLLADRFGVAVTTINKWLKKHHIPLNTKKATSRADWTKPWTYKYKIASAYKKHGTRTLAKKWGCNPTTIVNWLKKFGIPARLATGPGVTYEACYKPSKDRVTRQGYVRSSRYSKALKMEVAKCERCHYDEHLQILQVHHADHNTNNNRRNNLVVLCPNCHALDTHGIEKITKR